MNWENKSRDFIRLVCLWISIRGRRVLRELPEWRKKFLELNASISVRGIIDQRKLYKSQLETLPTVNEVFQELNVSTVNEEMWHPMSTLAVYL